MTMSSDRFFSVLTYLSKDMPLFFTVAQFLKVQFWSELITLSTIHI